MPSKSHPWQSDRSRSGGHRENAGGQQSHPWKIGRHCEKCERRGKEEVWKIIYLIKGFKELYSNHSYKLKLTANGRSKAFRAQILLITTTNSVGGFISFNPEASYDDDYLHVFWLKRFSPLSLITYLRYFVTGNLKNASGVRYFKTKSVKIEGLSDQTIEARIDGDPAMCVPFTVQTQPDFYRSLSRNIKSHQPQQ